MARGTKTPVSMRAVIQRINRKLSPRLEALKTTRGDRWRPELGDYYLLDLNRNCIIGKDVNPEKMAREIGVLEPWEEVRE
jgi:hypothetical protein